MPDEKILFVDDEPAALDGYKRILHREYTILSATSGAAGLEAIQSDGPFAVVVSDMRMPEMDGAAFLTRVKAVTPDAVRILLTGYADVRSAISAVNEGSVFRFLTKPCSKELLTSTLDAALEQYRLITAEKDLLERTLLGSVNVLAEVLSFVNPAAFGRALRVKRYITHICKKRNAAKAWSYEVAAMLCQLGCVAMESEIVEKADAGVDLNEEEQARYASHPQTAQELLAHIPRMENVAWMILHQNDDLRPDSPVAKNCDYDALTGARMIKLALSYDRLIQKGFSHREVLAELQRTAYPAEKALLSCMVDLEPETHSRRVVNCRLRDIGRGMVLLQDVRSNDGILLVAKGQELTHTLSLVLKKYCQRGAIGDSVLVEIEL